MTGSIVIGIGNPYRHDDGVGPAVIRRVAAVAPPDTEVVEELGEPAALVDRWTGRSLAIVVDAAESGTAPGTIHRLECWTGDGTEDRWPGSPARSTPSSHALGVGDAVALGRALGRLPGRLVVVGIEAAEMSSGVGLSAAVAAAIEPAVDLIVREIGEKVDVR